MIKMRNYLLLSILTICLFCSAQQAQAHYLWLDPTGQETVQIGDNISIDVYLHADTDDSLVMWGITAGFDNIELTYSSIDFGETVLGQNFYLPTYNSEESTITDIARISLFPGDPLEELTAGEDFLLFTANFTYNGGILDGEDMWLTWNPLADSFEFEPFAIYSLDDLYTAGSGVDFAASAVPVPGAFLLLGSGLLGFIGIKRKTGK